eukprot:TRINITY_DN8844_c0_g1_i1.p1 TRINITY_DN8844_c0_g1~~TRINITY_DN8844_c0_g1_i1.p1  ORF type:complete len:652 (+),score=69.90 TRINITY_DN8844_c0_g1_i1:321-2276(+)
MMMYTGLFFAVVCAWDVVALSAPPTEYPVRPFSPFATKGLPKFASRSDSKHRLIRDNAPSNIARFASAPSPHNTCGDRARAMGGGTTPVPSTSSSPNQFQVLLRIYSGAGSTIVFFDGNHTGCVSKTQWDGAAIGRLSDPRDPIRSPGFDRFPDTYLVTMYDSADDYHPAYRYVAYAEGEPTIIRANMPLPTFLRVWMWSNPPHESAPPPLDTCGAVTHLGYATLQLPQEIPREGMDMIVTVTAFPQPTRLRVVNTCRNSLALHQVDANFYGTVLPHGYVLTRLEPVGVVDSVAHSSYCLDAHVPAGGFPSVAMHARLGCTLPCRAGKEQFCGPSNGVRVCGCALGESDFSCTPGGVATSNCTIPNQLCEHTLPRVANASANTKFEATFGCLPGLPDTLCNVNPSCCTLACQQNPDGADCNRTTDCTLCTRAGARSDRLTSATAYDISAVDGFTLEAVVKTFDGDGPVSCAVGTKSGQKPTFAVNCTGLNPANVCPDQVDLLVSERDLPWDAPRIHYSERDQRILARVDLRVRSLADRSVVACLSPCTALTSQASRGGVADLLDPPILTTTDPRAGPWCCDGPDPFWGVVANCRRGPVSSSAYASGVRSACPAYTYTYDDNYAEMMCPANRATAMELRWGCARDVERVIGM